MRSLIASITLLFSIISAYGQSSSLHQAFVKPPDSVQLAVYWYWISDNVSKEGAVKDLHAMKKAGINRAFIGNIFADNVPVGPTKIFSKDWWEVIHAALKTAGELGIEIGIFNSPGWSQSGGPWVKPAESMRYLASNEMTMSGGRFYNASLPEFDAQDVKVLAYPMKATPSLFTWDVKNERTIELKVDKEVQSLILQLSKAVKAKAKLFGEVKGSYQWIKDFEIDRSNTALHVGFQPLAPVVIAVPPMKSYRLELEYKGSLDMEITLSTEALMERYPEKTLGKMFPTPLPLWDAYLWDAQTEPTNDVLSPSDVVDITAHYKDGVLQWQVPPGQWKIVRLGMVSTGVTNSPASPEATGLEIDKMSKTHVAAHFDAFIGEILRKIPAEDRKTFKVVVMDSYETGGQNWTDDMLERFKQVYNYDPVPYLPVMHGSVVGSRMISDKFLWDLRRLIADRVAYDYVGGLREKSNSHGLTTWLENYGHWGFPSEFMMYGGQSDEISGEYWSEGSLGDIENRVAASTGHTYGKNKIWAESFTAAGKEFARYPYLMKQRGDRFFAEGINATLLHLFVHQPYENKLPGMNAWFGNEFNRNNTWFEQLDVFIDYLKRCNLMLQQGRYIADVAYFIGEDVPKMTGVADPSLPKGYSFDYINAEILMTQATVKNGKLVLKSGMEYKVLVLPKVKSMRPELLKKLHKMVEEGLVILGNAPEYSPSLQNQPLADQEVKNISSGLWNGVSKDGFQQVGKGFVFGGEASLKTVLDKFNILPDFTVNNPEADIAYIHRTTKEGEMYFIANQKESSVAFKAQFRVQNGVPYLWDATSGHRRALPQFIRKGDLIEIPLELAALESAFIVFEDRKEAVKKGLNYPEGRVLKTFEADWKVDFIGLDAPQSTQGLGDWTASNATKYFSGKGVYTHEFSLANLPKEVVYLDLGKVMVMAKVFINDQYAGGAWSYPYRVDISKHVKKGKNTVRVEVVNNWKNKLIGDKHLPEDKRVTWAPINNLKTTSELQESGLLGPVRILSYDYVK
jgi:hypothetical protein